MTVHHFSTRELRDMADQITSRTISEPTPRRDPVKRDHGRGNHHLRFMRTPQGARMGRACAFPSCTYTDRITG